MQFVGCHGHRRRKTGEPSETLRSKRIKKGRLGQRTWPTWEIEPRERRLAARDGLLFHARRPLTLAPIAIELQRHLHATPMQGSAMLDRHWVRPRSANRESGSHLLIDAQFHFARC